MITILKEALLQTKQNKPTKKTTPETKKRQHFSF